MSNDARLRRLIRLPFVSSSLLSVLSIVGLWYGDGSTGWIVPVCFLPLAFYFQMEATKEFAARIDRPLPK